MARTNAVKPKAWSYKAGRKGHNRVRAYEEKGQLFLEFQVPVFDNQGKPEIDPRTGEQLKRRERISLSADGVTTYEDATIRCIEAAKAFDKLIKAPEPDEDSQPRGPVTLQQVLDLYLAEVTPTVKLDTQRQHRGHARVFLAYFGGDAVVERIDRHGRPCTSLGRVKYNAFLKARADGTVPGYPRKVRKQTQLNEVRFLRAVFNWAMVERDDGTLLMLRNPWKGFPSPVEDKPIREPMTEELHQQLYEGASNWRMAEILTIMRETRHRMNSVRQLALEDVDLADGTVRWLGEFDKAGQSRVNPLTRAAREAILRILEHRRREGVDGSRWLFPAPRNADKPVSKHTLHDWMRFTKKRLGIKVPRLGYHGEKRAGIRHPAFRQLPPAVQEELAGTTFETMRRVYDNVDLPEQKAAVAFLDGDVDRLPVSHRELRPFRKAA